MDQRLLRLRACPRDQAAFGPADLTPVAGPVVLEASVRIGEVRII